MALLVADGEVGYLQMQPGRTEQKIEIAKGIEVPEVASVLRDGVVVTAPQYLGAAQRVFDRLAKKPGEDISKELIAKQVEDVHRALLYGIDEPHTVDQLALAGNKRMVEPHQIPRRDRTVGVEDHQDVVPRSGESHPDRVALAASALSQSGGGYLRMRPDRLVNWPDHSGPNGSSLR